MQKKAIEISVIIPCYNNESTIYRAINSILLNAKNVVLEIICINDGSTDNTEKIINSLVKKHSNLKLISQENIGPAKSRNNGMQEASGQLMLFLDADDYIDKKISDLISPFKTCDKLEILTFGYNRVNNDGKTLFNTALDAKDYESGAICLDYLLNKDIGLTPMSSIYKTSFLKEKKIDFSSNTNFEDSYFFLKALSKSNHIKSSTLCYYNYVQQDFTRSKSYSKNNLIERCRLFCKILQLIKPVSVNFNNHRARFFIKTLNFIQVKECYLEVQNYLKSKLKNNNKIIIYGTGVSGQRLLSLLSTQNEKQIFFCDSNRDKNNTYIQQTKVVSIDNLNNHINSESKIIIASCFIDSISVTLSKLGYSSNIKELYIDELFEHLKVNS
ncbi:glycosyltransferase family 2 protein [Motilimonas cestriensis]|uniref:Glycosyltransferase family 2 protein n=1 Tax=Motilimonas cestriensis TaxID=2742685 RepID=A0ABS8W978_9GAMM|nr:glycosyltransferase family 2 protein [Motilimonas cestriensis]MCE2595569.1 glycosyltransferase family 2 protein [Motilimonas cestriensis]